MGSVEVLGVGSACAAGAAVFALHAPFAKLAPAPIAWAPSSCRRPRPRASEVVWSGIVADSHSHARHVRWCALTPARGRGSLDTKDRMSTRAAAETSARACRDAGDSDYDARDETKNAAVVERVAVLVLAATGIPIGETEAALEARPGLVRALVSKDVTDDDRLRGAASSVNDVDTVDTVDTVRRDERSMSERAASASRETFRAERRAASALRFLTREVGFSAETLARTLRARNGHGFALVAADVDETSRRTFAFLRQPRAAGGAGLSAAAAARAASRDPRLLLADAEDVRARFAWLTDVAGVRPADAFATHAESRESRDSKLSGRDSSLVMLVSPVPPTRELASAAGASAADPEDAFGTDRLGAAYEFLRVECCLGAFATRAMLRKYPNALTKDVENTMRPALVALRAHVSGDAAAKVIAKYPSVLTLLPETLEKKFFFLRETCALDGERINKLVSAAPSIVTLSVTNNLQPTFAFLAYELGLGEDGARAVLAKAPSVFGLRRENVGPKFAFFAERAGRDAAVAIFTKAPSLLGTSLERNIAPTAGWIVETCVSVGFGRAPGGELRSSTTRGARPNDDDDFSLKKTRPWDPRAVDVLVSCPSLLGMSVERKLAPTLAFLLAHFPDAPAPILFRAGTFSLRGHVAPRVFLLAESGAIHRWAPGTFLAWNVGTFCEKAGVSREAYDAKVRSCKSEELDMPIPVPNDATLGGGFSLKKKTSVRSETAGRDGAVSKPRDGDETETGTDASASIRSAIRARAEGGGAAGRDRGSTPAERARARRAAKRRADAEKDE